MAKKMVKVKCNWIEVAPSLFVFPQKNSHSPKLETIKEDDTAELGQDGDAWRTVCSSSDDEDSAYETKNNAEEEKREFDSVEVKFPYKFQKMIQNGFWVFVDMASGKYLWRNLKSLHKAN
ncbi:hypothetical protein HAX54_009606 [Datura stramonium]|uniref:Uncharacterized protein n=1 Tax=Datura stramonium TaxID=4076 RepID=A0ABS8TGS0_DATST|nr:hypothetical protein [Datura stramonium]